MPRSSPTNRASSWWRVPWIAAAACALLTATASAAAPAPTTPIGPGDEIRLVLPPPTGPYPVGVRTESVFDQSRIDPTTHQARRIPIWVWYPARDTSTGPSAPYLSAGIQAWAEDALGAPAGLFDIDTHAIADAPARHRPRAVIVLDPGGSSNSAFQTGQVIDLASRGYAVVTLDHPHGSLAVEEPDGTLILNDSDPLSERLLDIDLVIDDLRRLVPEAGRGTPLGMLGHSRGAAALAEAMYHDGRIDAGLALDIGTVLFFGEDGGPPGDVVAGGLDQPLGMMCSVDLPCDLPFIADFVSRLRGPHEERMVAYRHNVFTDFAVFNPIVAKVDPGLAAVLESSFETGLGTDAIAGRQSLALQRRFIARFFGRHL